jgi:hypothetical protein
MASGEGGKRGEEEIEQKKKHAVNRHNRVS